MPSADAPDRARSLLHELDEIERAARSDAPCCAGCALYWEDDAGDFKPWGYCRLRPPDFDLQHELGADRLSVPTVSYNWYCGQFRRGCHPAVMQQRKLWRGEYQAIIKSGK